MNRFANIFAELMYANNNGRTTFLRSQIFKYGGLARYFFLCSYGKIKMPSVMVCIGGIPPKLTCETVQR